MSTDIDTEPSEPEMTEQHAVEQLAAQGAAATDRPQRFTKPGPVTAREQDMRELFEQREDDPPPAVPRDQWDRPIIVTPDGDLASYIRASSYGCIEDRYGIHEWKRKQVVYGLSRAFHLVQRAQSASGTATKSDNAILKEVADRAEIIAASDAGSLTGTAIHKLSERRDEGADLSYLDPNTTACLDAYGRLMAPFEVLATELFVVCDDYGSAGTLDRAVRLRWDLVFPDGTVLPAGTIIVIDVKTGKITSVKYWMAEYSCQQFIYDNGLPYFPGVTHLADPKVRSIKNIERVTDQPGNNGRVSWDEVGVPGGPNHDYSLILHVPAACPDKARIILVRLGEARLDADVCRDAWARRRVSWADRFAALGAEQLVPPDERQGMVVSGGRTVRAGTPSKIKNLEVDSAVSETPAAPEPPDEPGAVQAHDSGGATGHVNPTLVAALLQRIARAQHPADVQAIWEAWEQSPSWTDEVHNASCDRWDALTVPTDVAECDGCNYDTHRCPGCGTDTPHGVAVCAACSLRAALESAPDRATINVLWTAHGPDGDAIWSDEHQAIGVERYCALPATDEWPDLDTGEPEQSAADEQQPETDLAGPPPDGDGAAPGPTVNGLEPSGGSTSGPGAATADATGPPADPPGPFDGTLDLADLRDMIDEALDTATVDELYDRYGPDAGGPWDDDCNARAQAAYDRYGPRDEGIREAQS